MDVLRQIEKRRRDIGMSRADLARRSAVSLPTVNRILSGSQAASFANVVALAKALGMEIVAAADLSSEKLRRQQARKKARQLVGMVQGTSALEGQALDRSEIETMVGKTSNDLLGSNRKLWSL